MLNRCNELPRSYVVPRYVDSKLRGTKPALIFKYTLKGPVAEKSTPESAILPI